MAEVVTFPTAVELGTRRKIGLLSPALCMEQWIGGCGRLFREQWVGGRSVPPYSNPLPFPQGEGTRRQASANWFEPLDRLPGGEPTSFIELLRQLNEGILQV